MNLETLEDMYTELGIKITDDNGHYKTTSQVINDFMGMWNVLSSEARDKVKKFLNKDKRM